MYSSSIATGNEGEVFLTFSIHANVPAVILHIGFGQEHPPKELCHKIRRLKNIKELSNHMAENDFTVLRVKFLKIFANLPEKIREDIVAVIDNNPYSWNVAAIEIKNQSTIGNKILKNLKKMEIL